MESPSNETIYVPAEKFIRDRLGKEVNNVEMIDNLETIFSSVEDSSNSESSPESERSKLINNLILEVRRMSGLGTYDRQKEDEPQLSTSSGRKPEQREPNRELSTSALRKCMEDKFESARREEMRELVREAERGKACILKPPDKAVSEQNNLSVYEQDDELFHYTVHINEATVNKIQNGKYMDLAKLLPKEHILHNDGSLRMIEKDGMSFLQPVTEKILSK